MVIGESVLRAASDRRLKELLAYWAGELDGAQTEDEKRVCERMLEKYQGELERRAHGR